MIPITIPSRKPLQIEHAVFDYNGTLACEGVIKAGVLERLKELALHVTVHVITADTYGSAHEACAAPYLNLHVIETVDQDLQKRDVITHLNPQRCIALGNGRNDALMLEHAAIGMALLQEEGCSRHALLHADMLFTEITDAIDAIVNPSRIVATLRN